jgi:hypothetical protein
MLKPEKRREIALNLTNSRDTSLGGHESNGKLRRPCPVLRDHVRSALARACQSRWVSSRACGSSEASRAAAWAGVVTYIRSSTVAQIIRRSWRLLAQCLNVIRCTFCSAEARKRLSDRPRVASIAGIGKCRHNGATQFVGAYFLRPTNDCRFDENSGPRPLQTLGVAQSLGKGRDDNARLTHPKTCLTRAIAAMMDEKVGPSGHA